MYWITRIAAAAAATVALALPATANAAPVQSAAPESSSETLAACTYRINANDVNIRYGPGTDYGVYTTKDKGARVTGPAPCYGTVFRTGYWWVQLIRGDGGGYVWVAENYV
jgi:uncharacterized protein YgiM (DUF1202 family)